MLKKITKIVFISLIINFINLAVYAQVIDLSSSKNIFRIKSAEIYKPSKLIIGEETGFVIKADPGTYVTLVFSGESSGAAPVYGQNLRIGTVFDKVEGIVGEKGIIELKLKIPEEKTLGGKIIYFEALTWQQKDLSDLATARIMGIDGKETYNNALIMANKINDSSTPIFTPSMPGMGNVSDTMNALSGQNNEENEELREEMYYRNKDLMLRNLNAPELQEEDEEN